MHHSVGVDQGLEHRDCKAINWDLEFQSYMLPINLSSACFRVVCRLECSCGSDSPIKLGNFGGSFKFGCESV